MYNIPCCLSVIDFFIICILVRECGLCDTNPLRCNETCYMCGTNIWDIFVSILYVLPNNVNAAGMGAVLYVSSHVKLANIHVSMCVLILVCLSYQFQSDVLKSLISL